MQGATMLSMDLLQVIAIRRDKECGVPNVICNAWSFDIRLSVREGVVILVPPATASQRASESRWESHSIWLVFIASSPHHSMKLFLLCVTTLSSSLYNHPLKRPERYVL